MELGSIRNIPLLPNFSGKLAQFLLDRKRDQKGGPRRSPAGDHVLSWPGTPSLLLFFQETKILLASSASPTLSQFNLATPHQLFPFPSPGCNYLNSRHKHFPILEILHLFLLKMTSSKLGCPK